MRPEAKATAPLRSRRDAGHPFAAEVAEDFDGAVGGDRSDLAVLAAADQPRIGGVGDGGQQALMRLRRLVAVVEPVNGAVGEREEGHAADEGGGHAMAVEIEWRDCRHAAAVRPGRLRKCA